MGRLVFSTVFQPLLLNPKPNTIKLCDLNPGSVLEITGEFIAQGGYTSAIYHTNNGDLTGWVKKKWVEDYVLTSAIIKIKNPTTSLSDAAQYLYYNGQVQYNLCGQFCVMYCADQEEVDIEDWLDSWKLKQSPWWKRVFGGGKGTTTGIPELNDMLSLFEGYKLPAANLQDYFRDDDLGRPLLTPGRLYDFLQLNRGIFSCRIETQFGRLRPTGVGHWIALESIELEGRGGVVKIYNPFSNSHERYDWDTFMDSVKVPYGVVVPR